MIDTLFENFSAGYYRTTMTVEQYDDGPTISTDLYQYMYYELYRNLDILPVVTIGMDSNKYFVPKTETTIPTDILAVTEKFFEEYECEPSDSISVFVPKPAYAQYIVLSATEYFSEVQ